MVPAPPPSAPGNAGQPELGQLADDELDVGGVEGVDGVAAAVTVTFAVAAMPVSAWLVAVTVSVSAFDGAV
jgi:hypothetical protein